MIARELKERGTPNHLLVNKVAEYSIDHFYSYCVSVWGEMQKRGFPTTFQSSKRIENLNGNIISPSVIFEGWHNKEYLRVCMANLYEKHVFGVGSSRISDKEWATLSLSKQCYKEAIKELEKKSENRLIELYEKYHEIANKPKKEKDMFYQGRAEAIWECITINRNFVKEMVGEE